MCSFAVVRVRGSSPNQKDEERVSGVDEIASIKTEGNHNA